MAIHTNTYQRGNMYNIDNDFTPLQPQHTLLQNAKGVKDQKNLRGYESLIANKT